MISDFAEKMTLRELVSIKAGYPIRGKIERVDGSGIRAVRLKDVSFSDEVNRDGVNWDDCIETELTGRVEPQWLQQDDVLFAAHGSHNTATFIGDSFNNKPFKAVATPMFFVLRAINNLVLPEYLAWYINSYPSQRYFEKNAEGSRTKSVRRQALEQLEIPVPELEKQLTIVALMKNLHEQQRCLTNLIERNQATLNAIAFDLSEKAKKHEEQHCKKH